MIDCGVCGKEFEIEEEYKDHVAQAHEAMNSTYSEAFCLQKAEEKTCPSCHGSGSVSSNGETEDCPRCLGNGVISTEADELTIADSGHRSTQSDYFKDKIKEADSDDKLGKVDALSESWGRLNIEEKAQIFESLGIKQGSAYTLANLDWYNLSPQLKKDASEAYVKEAKFGDFDDDRISISYKGKNIKDTKDIEKEEENEVNEAYRDFYDIEKYHDSPDYKKKAIEYSLDDECPYCHDKIKEPETLDYHMEQEHGAHIPSQYTQTGIQGAMAGTDFDKLDDDYYSESKATEVSGLAENVWSEMNDSERFGCNFGMFPAWIDEKYPEGGHDLVMDLMTLAKQRKPASFNREAKATEVEGKCPYCGSSDISSD